MSAELVDPFATSEPDSARASDDGYPSRPEQTTSSRAESPDLAPDEWVAIRDEIQDAPWLDPARLPELVREAVKVLGDVALSGDPFSRRAATQCLRGMAYRAKNGSWPNEPREPAWSLDPDPKQYHAR